MNRGTRLAAVIAVAAALLSTAGCNKLRARDQLNKGVQAYRSAHYETAINHFQNAVGLDDDLVVAKRLPQAGERDLGHRRGATIPKSRS